MSPPDEFESFWICVGDMVRVIRSMSPLLRALPMASASLKERSSTLSLFTVNAPL